MQSTVKWGASAAAGGGPLQRADKQTKINHHEKERKRQGTLATLQIEFPHFDLKGVNHSGVVVLREVEQSAIIIHCQYERLI